MQITIYGAGAIGGYLGALLCRSGADVSLIARGPHLAAMQQNGVRLISADDDFVVHPKCTDDPSRLGPQDYVIICLKAHSIPAAVDDIRPLLGADTTIVTAINGIPYWYFHGLGGPLEGYTVESVDPGGRQWSVFGPRRALGCILYPATEVAEPGVIRHISGNKFPLGEPSGETSSPRLLALQALFEEAGLKAPALERIRDELWLKLWGNLAFNPISALTHGTLDVIAFDPATRRVVDQMMSEAETIAHRLGVEFRVSRERRIDGAGRVGAHKTSMLQDLEKGRPLEIDALVGVIQELGALTEVATPTIDTILALIRQRAVMCGNAQTSGASTPPLEGTAEIRV